MSPLGVLLHNPCWRLGVGVDATPTEIQREAKKVEAMLAIGKVGADLWVSPFGQGTRSVEAVRWAASELGDPARRLVWELWATPVPGPLPTPDALPITLMRSVGWGDVLKEGP